MSKGLKKEDLEQDILIEYSSRFMYYYENNKATVIGGAIGLLLVIGLIIGYFVYSGQQEQEAQNLLGIAEEQLMQGNYETALYGNEQDFTLGFEQISNNYPRTSAGNLATYYASVSEYELGNYENALQRIQNFDVPDGIMGVAPLSLNAIILSELDRFEEAGQKYLEAAEWNINDSTTPYNLMEAAIAFREAGDTDRALEMVDRVLEDYPNSQQAAEAKRMRGLLTRPV
ncbi:tetratricopeptide repeat protein [Rhodohalobacter sp. 8-1]|uniref:tetratricopeptide repeat protein n=1 Tax=Rhodohalobacter sp. 8-1 TaxID=3131972 RepID=UPI0030EDC64C